MIPREALARDIRQILVETCRGEIHAATSAIIDRVLTDAWLARPSPVEGVVEALRDYITAKDNFREFERENPNNSTWRWDAVFTEVEDGETKMRAALTAYDQAQGGDDDHAG